MQVCVLASVYVYRVYQKSGNGRISSKKHSILEKNVSDKVVEFKTILKINAMSWLISSYN